MAPELASGVRVTSTLDVYSFGCVVDEVISEKRCYYDYDLSRVDSRLVWNCFSLSYSSSIKLFIII